MRNRGFLVAATLLLGAGLAGPLSASLSSVPTPWSNFNGLLTAHTFGGIPARDYESTGSCKDPTNGGAAFTAEVDIASAGSPYSITNCSPAVNGTDTCCGTGTSAFYAYYNGGTPGPGDGTCDPTTVLDDFILVRMRVNADPRASDRNCMSNSHWNFLIDWEDKDEIPYTGPDGFKEWWVDVWGNQARVRILYENLDDDGDAGTNVSNTVSNDFNIDGVAPYTETVINEMVSCAVANDDTGGTPTTNGCNPYNRNCVLSFTRACSANTSLTNLGECLTDAGAPQNPTGEWFVDVQFPVSFLRDGTGTFPQATNPVTDLLQGVQLIPQDGACPPQWSPFYSTSDSSVNPLQKDYIANCTNAPVGPCATGDTTPITLSYFRAERSGAGVVVEWSTESENGNVGFDLYAKRDGRFEKVTSRPAASKALTALARNDYRLELPGVDGFEFMIEDMDILGRRHRHGPFTIEQTYGSRQATPVRDWAPIRAEHEAKAKARRAEEILSEARGIRLGATPVVDLLVDRDGIYRVTYEQLLGAGFNFAGVPSSHLALTASGVPVKIRVGGSGLFGAGSFIEFVGKATGGIYTRTNVYRLSVDKGRAARVTEIASSRAGDAVAPAYFETIEVNDDLNWSFASPADDPWYRDFVVAFPGGPAEKTYGLQVDHLGSSSGAVLHLDIWGMTDWAFGPDHHVLVSFNGQPVADERFDGLGDLSLDIPLPDGAVVQGANTLKVQVPGDAGVDYEVINVDRFGLSFQRPYLAQAGSLDFTGVGAKYEVDGFSSSAVVAYQIADASVYYLKNLQAFPSALGYRARFGGAVNLGLGPSEYWVSEVAAALTPELRPAVFAPGLRSGAAEYLVISHPDFVSGLAPLVAARQAQGLTVKVVTTDEIYGEFGAGIFGPEAIRDYIRFAAANLKTRMVLLVGGDTYDYFDNLGVGSISFVPTLYALIGPIVRWAPSDSLFGDLDDDMVPDIAVGRFPVHTGAELAAMVAKTLDYPTAGHQGRALFAADKGGLGGNFASLNESAISLVPQSWEITRANIDEVGLASARASLLGALNNGVAYAQYMGHSDLDFWSFDNLLTVADVDGLLNAGLPPVVTQWGCWNTFYVMPTASSIADRLLVDGEHGAAAVMGPSSLTNVDSEGQLNELLATEIFTNGRMIGDAMVAAKQALAAQRPWQADVIRAFNLMGDPALKVLP